MTWSCKAASGAVDELRKQYDGRVTFVVKYFPNSGHFNAERAARAVESAAQQGQFEAMFQKMFATQLEWGAQVRCVVAAWLRRGRNPSPNWARRATSTA